MDKSLTEIGRSNDIGDVLEFARLYCVRLGCARTSYHFSPAFDEPTSTRTIIVQHGFSPVWMELYEKSGFRNYDPIPDRTLRHGAPISWSDALAMGPLTPDQKEYVAMMKQHGLEHGFGLPLYGPKGRDAYSSFDFGIPLAEVDQGTKATITALAQAAHLRICQILEKRHEPSSLSDREAEVINLVALGKSNNDIGTILEISPETVRTYTQRIYDKLGARNRIGAAIKALRLGLLHN